MAERSAWRAQMRRRLQLEAFDVAIVGGGITGAGIAREAALRGMRVALLEARDFASGTSSRSSRLVHGGVRYLEHGHLHLVFESSRERRILLHIAPHLVRPLAFMWPVYRNARISRMRLSLGLGLYDALSMFRNVARHERLSRSEVLEHEPRLRSDELVGGARYYDASTDDSRLTLANVLSAVEAGAVALNHATVTGFDVVAGRVRGLRGQDEISDEPFSVRAAVVVNASGPWSDDVRSLESRVEHQSVAGSRGAHIAVPRARVGNHGAVTMIHPTDGRVLFTLPAGDQTIVGTTETRALASERDTRASNDDVTYLLAAANTYFPDAALSVNDVVAAWSGIRPLARQLASSDVGSASREHAIERGPKGVIHVTGGKLTTYREMASQVVDLFSGPEAKTSTTAVLPLPGGDRPLDDVIADASEVLADVSVRDRLVAAYGSRWRDVVSLAEDEPRLGERVSESHPVIAAELVHAVKREMAMTLGDVLIRRTRLAFETTDQGRSIAPDAARLIQPLMGWSDSERAATLDAYRDEVDRMFG